MTVICDVLMGKGILYEWIFQPTSVQLTLVNNTIKEVYIPTRDMLRLICMGSSWFTNSIK